MKQFSFSLAILPFFLLASAGLRAQHKVGYINMDELISAMPETGQAQKLLRATADSLSRVDANLQQGFATAKDAFFQDSASMDKTKKEAQRKVLQQLLQQYNQFRADAKEELDSTQQALTVAIEAKAQRAIEATAKANGYTYVFSKVAGANDQQREFIIVGPQGNDLLPLVKKQLGLIAN